MPNRIPSVAVVHSDAAVVRPRDVEAFAKNDPAAQKADAGQNPVRHSHRIDANHLDGGVVEPCHLMHRGYHQQAARQAD